MFDFFYDFYFYFIIFWNGKKDQIKRKTLCQAFEQGGLKLVNIHEYLSAMKINWLRRIFQPDNCLVKNVLFAVCPAFANIRGFGGEYANIVHRLIQNPFWAQVLMHYKRFCAKCQPKCFTEFLTEHIHYNSHIVRDKIFFMNDACVKTVTMVKHSMDEEGNILSFVDFHEIFPNVGLDFLTYHGLASSAMTYQKKKKKFE